MKAAFPSVLVAVLATAASHASHAEPQWISHPEAITADAAKAPVTLEFRKQLTLSRVPEQAWVRLSADNRYIFYVNGQRVSSGPARGDLNHWRYRRLDLKPYLRAGDNLLTAIVWNDAAVAPLAQISAGTGFWFAADGRELAALNSGSGWEVRLDPSRQIVSGREQLGKALGRTKFFAAAPAEIRLGGTPAGSWTAVVPGIATAERKLEADRLPEMLYAAQPGGQVVKMQGLRAHGFPLRPLAIPPRSDVTIVLDAGRLQTAFPELRTSGGAGAKVWLTYAEAPADTKGDYLANRADVAGGEIRGLTDEFQPAGGSAETFRPLWWRTWRYLAIHVKTADAPLRLQSLTRYETGFPFVRKGWFRSSDPELDRIWQIGWDTVRVDAHETYMDTAYWEQYQYIGDTRIEALVTRLLTADPRLPTQAIEAFDNAKVDGLPPSRWPSRVPQSIPPFALLWIGMLHDAWLYEPGADQMVAQRLPGVRSILDWYARYVGPDGLVGTTPGWEFIDWRPGLDNYPRTTDPKGTETCIISLFAVGAMRQAAEMEASLKETRQAAQDTAAADQLAAAIRAQCWSAERGMFANRPDKQAFSQHANLLAVLHDVAPRERQRAIMERITLPGSGIDAPEGVTPVTFYFAYYLAQAMDHAGLGERYLDLIKPWREMLSRGFTSWPETPDPTRSDSHAWSSHPTADLMTIVAGIKPAAPGFAAVRIAPQLGSLRKLDAAIAHPSGLIRVRYQRTALGLNALIDLPPGLTGTFEWNGQRRTLRQSTNPLSLRD